VLAPCGGKWRVSAERGLDIRNQVTKIHQFFINIPQIPLKFLNIPQIPYFPPPPIRNPKSAINYGVVESVKRKYIHRKHQGNYYKRLSIKNSKHVKHIIIFIFYLFVFS